MRRSIHLIVVGLLGCIAAIFLHLSFAEVASAETLTVTTVADSGPGSLRQLIADANRDDTIRFDAQLAGQTIILERELLVNHTITIDASATPNLVVSGNQSVRVINTSAALTLTGFTIRDGVTTESGGGIRTTVALTLLDMILVENSAALHGGAIEANRSRLTIIRSAFISNSASSNGGYGGAISLFQGSLIIEKSRFVNNRSATGGALSAFTMEKTHIRNSDFSQNQAVDNGGALAVTSGNIEIVSTLFANNRADTGGGIYVAAPLLPTIRLPCCT